MTKENMALYFSIMKTSVVWRHRSVTSMLDRGHGFDPLHWIKQYKIVKKNTTFHV